MAPLNPAIIDVQVRVDHAVVHLAHSLSMEQIQHQLIIQRQLILVAQHRVLMGISETLNNFMVKHVGVMQAQHMMLASLHMLIK